MITVGAYLLIGVFGYITFANNLHILNSTHLANGVILFAYGYDAQGNKQTFPLLILIVISYFLSNYLIYNSGYYHGRILLDYFGTFDHKASKRQFTKYDLRQKGLQDHYIQTCSYGNKYYLINC